MKLDFVGEPTFCDICDGINLVWNDQREILAAPYVEGGSYCFCSDKELEGSREGRDGVDN